MTGDDYSRCFFVFSVKICLLPLRSSGVRREQNIEQNTQQNMKQNMKQNIKQNIKLNTKQSMP